MLDGVDRAADGEDGRRALRKAPGVMTSRGLRSSRTISTMRVPDCRAMSNIFGLLARTGALLGSVIPSASQATCIEFAVAMPWQTPGPRIAFSAIPRSRSRSSFPKETSTEPRKTSSMSTSSPSSLPHGW
jgi:hypothetical protein